MQLEVDLHVREAVAEAGDVTQLVAAEPAEDGGALLEHILTLAPDFVVAASIATSHAWAAAATSDAVWTRKCENLWADKVYVPTRFGVYLWPQARWSGREADAELRLVQLFSADDRSFGHELGRANEWMEVMRSDSRPYFEEGIRPPNCTDWSPGETYHQQECWRDLHGWGGGRFPPGCWARPAVGTGVWINANRTRHANDLEDWQSIFNASSTSWDQQELFTDWEIEEMCAS